MEKKKYCQNCKHHKNNPSVCFAQGLPVSTKDGGVDIKPLYVPRKSTCDQWRAR